MANIFLTGATGFIGSHVAQKLVLQNHKVTCLVRKTSKLDWIENLPIQMCKGSLDNPNSYKNAIMDTEYIIHIAGVTKAANDDGYYIGNFELTKNLLETIDDVGKNLQRFLLVSSQAAVGPSPTADPIDEDYPCQPITSYGKSKLMAEQITFDFSEKYPVTVIRPPAVYGPRDTDIYLFFKYLRNGFNLSIGKVDQLLSLVFVDDLARGIVDAIFASKAINNLYFLCDDTPYRWSYVAQFVADYMNKKYFNLNIPYFIAYALAFVLEKYAVWTNRTTILNREKIYEIKQPYWVISPEKAKKDLLYKTDYPLKEGIKHTIQWYEENKWL